MNEGFNVAIAGATGAVGMELLRLLERRAFPVANLTLLASARSAGKRLEFRGESIAVEELKADSFKAIEFAFFSPGGAASREFAPHAVAAGAVVIDNTSAFRMKPDVPLVVPEVNPDDLDPRPSLIANPNCCAAILAVALWPLHCAAGLRRVVVTMFQSASGAGARAMAELETQSRAVLDGREVVKEALPHQIAFNLFSHNAAIEDNGYNGEENKIIAELRKIMHAPELPVVPTCIRVPVFRAHSASVVIETDRPLSAAEARDILAKAPGVKVVDDRAGNHFPMPIEATGDLDVHVGRLRDDLSHERGLAFFVSGDQLLKGAAWNALQIAELLIKRN